jgi:hypothetical protein
MLTTISHIGGARKPSGSTIDDDFWPSIPKLLEEALEELIFLLVISLCFSIYLKLKGGLITNIL